jgi:hypothetical protein
MSNKLVSFYYHRGAPYSSYLRSITKKLRSDIERVFQFPVLQVVNNIYWFLF